MNEYLLVSDFDGCLARTFEPSPNGIDVNKAYKRAVTSIFGSEGSRIYEEIGGLSNRAPGELVDDLLANGDRETLVKQARTFFQERGDFLRSLAYQEKLPSLKWENRGLWDPRQIITEMLVRCKLSCLMDEIGEKWPSPCEGALEFLRFVGEKANEEGVDIRLAILSSGHEAFIRKTFSVWGIPCPAVLVTDDNMRWRSWPEDLSARTKPSVILLDLVQLMWFKSRNETVTDQLQLIRFLLDTRSKMIYFGDDRIRDGELAEKAGIPFGWFNPDGRQAASLPNSKLFSFSDWRTVSYFFSQRETIQALKENKPLEEIILPLAQNK